MRRIESSGVCPVLSTDGFDGNAWERRAPPRPADGEATSPARRSTPTAVVFVVSTTALAMLFGGLVGWSFMQLDADGQRIVTSAGVPWVDVASPGNLTSQAPATVSRALPPSVRPELTAKANDASSPAALSGAKPTLH